MCPRPAAAKKAPAYEDRPAIRAEADIVDVELAGHPGCVRRVKRVVTLAVGFVGLGAAVDYLDRLGMDHVERREAELLAHLTESLQEIDGLRIFGTAPDKAAVVAFLIEGAHAHDLATLLDLEGVAIRSGQHCAHPLLQYYGVAATCRASLAFYNTHEEIERFMTALTKVRKLLG